MYFLTKEKMYMLGKKLDCVIKSDFSNAAYYRDQEVIIDEKIKKLYENRRIS